MTRGEGPPAGYLRALRAVGSHRSWRHGEILFRQGDTSDFVVLIESGQVRVGRINLKGQVTTLANRHGGELVGEFSAIDQVPRSATVTAVGSVSGVVVPADRFRSALLHTPEYALFLLEQVVRRVRESDRWRAEFGTLPTMPRIARLLYDLAIDGDVRWDSEGGIVLPLRNVDLASRASASRESVTRGLRALREAGAIRTGRDGITIVDLQTLAKMCVI